MPTEEQSNHFFAMFPLIRFQSFRSYRKDAESASINSSSHPYLPLIPVQHFLLAIPTAFKMRRLNLWARFSCIQITPEQLCSLTLVMSVLTNQRSRQRLPIGFHRTLFLIHTYACHTLETHLNNMFWLLSSLLDYNSHKRIYFESTFGGLLSILLWKYLVNKMFLKKILKIWNPWKNV